jgi:hypothetical protein
MNGLARVRIPGRGRPDRVGLLRFDPVLFHLNAEELLHGGPPASCCEHDQPPLDLRALPRRISNDAGDVVKVEQSPSLLSTMPFERSTRAVFPGVVQRGQVSRTPAPYPSRLSVPPARETSSAAFGGDGGGDVLVFRDVVVMVHSQSGRPFSSS